MGSHRPSPSVSRALLARAGPPQGDGLLDVGPRVAVVVGVGVVADAVPVGVHPLGRVERELVAGVVVPVVVGVDQVGHAVEVGIEVAVEHAGGAVVVVELPLGAFRLVNRSGLVDIEMDMRQLASVCAGCSGRTRGRH